MKVSPCATESSYELTNEMSTLLNNPSGGTMEPMVVTRGEVDDTEEKGISGSDATS